MRDAAREVGFAVAVAVVSGFLSLSLASASVQAQSVVLFTAALLGTPVVGAIGWGVARRRVPWRRRGVWAEVGAWLGALLWLPALYLGTQLARMALPPLD